MSSRRRPAILVPSSAALQPTHRVPRSPAVTKALSRLSRASLVALVLEWLGDGNQPLCRPVLEGDDEEEEEGEEEGEEGIYMPAQSIEELREVYMEMGERRGGKAEVVGRVLEGDWRRGLNLYQLATIDLKYLSDRPTSQKWSALKLVRVHSPSDKENAADGSPDKATPKGDDNPDLPRFHASTFLRNLHHEIGGLVKAHYHLTHHSTLPLLRILTLDPTTPTTTTTRTIYLAFPKSTPHIYISLPPSGGGGGAGGGGAAELRSLRKIILDALPKALSRPRQRWELQGTALSANSLSAMIFLRGAGRGEKAAGGWSVFLDDGVDANPFDPVPARGALAAAVGGARALAEKENLLPPPQPDRPTAAKRKVSGERPDDRARAKRLCALAAARFGTSGRGGDGRGIEGFGVRIGDPFWGVRGGGSVGAGVEIFEDEEGENRREQQRQRRPTKGRTSLDALFPPPPGADGDTQEAEAGSGSRQWRPTVRLQFQGSHVFAGVRRLVEGGVVDAVRMPGWLTGEDGVSFGEVRGGRIS